MGCDMVVLKNGGREKSWCLYAQGMTEMGTHSLTAAWIQESRAQIHLLPYVPGQGMDRWAHSSSPFSAKGIHLSLRCVLIYCYGKHSLSSLDLTVI